MAARRRQRRDLLGFWLPLLLLLLTTMGQAGAAPRARSTVAAFADDRYASIVIEGASGKVMQQENADAPRRPASLAKLMTLYMTFEALRDRRVSLDEQVPVSAHAASMEPTKLGFAARHPFHSRTGRAGDGHAVGERCRRRHGRVVGRR